MSDSEHPSHPGLSRRGLLGGLVVGGVGWGAVPSSAAHADLRTVKPLNSHALKRSVGVNAMPNHLRSNYRFHEEWVRAVADHGFGYLRGLYAPGLPVTQEVVRRARAHGVRWGMQVASDLGTSETEVAATVRHIATHAADRCAYVEGVNEPDWVRGVGPSPSGWHERAVALQAAIWRAVRSEPRLAHVDVLGPSLRDVSATDDDHRRLRDLGLLANLDYVTIHRYPNGHYPDHLLDDRLSRVRRLWPGRRVWITETGYHNALGDSTGHKPVPEWVARDYAPAAVLEAADRGARLSWFELLDQPDQGGKDQREDNFGLLAVGDDGAPPWRPKPAADALRRFLGSLDDPGPGFDPRPVQLEVLTDARDVRTTVTVKRSGRLTAHVRRATPCWDPIAQRPVPVEIVDVRLRTATGTQTLSVDHRVASVLL